VEGKGGGGDIRFTPPRKRERKKRQLCREESIRIIFHRVQEELKGEKEEGGRLPPGEKRGIIKKGCRLPVQSPRRRGTYSHPLISRGKRKRKKRNICDYREKERRIHNLEHPVIT